MKTHTATLLLSVWLAGCALPGAKDATPTEEDVEHEAGQKVSLAALLQGLMPDIAGIDDVEVHGLQADSRRVVPGDAFLACGGLRAHGLQHLDQAIARGAAAVVWEPTEDAGLVAKIDSLPLPAVRLAGLRQKLGLVASRFYAEPSRDMHVIGVTGTDGKTSVTHFLAQALSTRRTT